MVDSVSYKNHQSLIRHQFLSTKHRDILKIINRRMKLYNVSKYMEKYIIHIQFNYTDIKDHSRSQFVYEFMNRLSFQNQ